MRRPLFLSCLVSLCCITHLQAQVSASFNFTAAPVSVSGWTNVSGDPSTGVRTATSSSGISISSVSTANWSGLSGNASYDGGGMPGGTFFPANVMLNHWFQSGSSTGAYNAAVPQLIISGLSIDSVYTVSMTGSWSDAFYNLDPTRYTVIGATVYGYVDLNIRYNTANGAVFHNVAPNSSGQIKVYVNTVPTTDIAGISGLSIVSGHSSGVSPTVLVTSPSTGVTLPEDANVTISANASETGGSISHVEFYLDTVKIGDDSTAPYSMLWIASDPGSYSIKARAIDGFGNTSTSTVYIKVENLNYFWSTTGNIATNADTFFLGTVDTNRLAIRTNNVERISVLADGSVGVGTKSTHGYKLAVNGSAIFTKVSIRNYASWPDYVFKDGYRLPGLDSLERYIRVNQHLPGIISADKAKEQPIDLADNQALLLQKVEELTLYLIREHKKVEALTREVRRLKTQINKKPGKTGH
ncbi:MAG TPA: Ig-like domain-containing protein [Puia sp.]|nr:Ig-like domain-containing protein [Puia sp.]